MEIWILILVINLGPDKFLYDPAFETVSKEACQKQADFVRQTRGDAVQTFCVKKR